MKENPTDTSSKEFQNALRIIRDTHQSLFLTGKAGTGKSTFLRYVCKEVDKKHVVLAPTGIAAINAGGSTLHSFFKLPFHPLLLDDPKFSIQKIRDFLKYKKSHVKLLQEVELIIIDEISMVRVDIIDFIDRVLRVYCGKMREPFGGKQMLFVGDVFQLEPVVKSDEREILGRFYPNSFFFSALAFQQMRLVCIELKKVYRQKDGDFVAALDQIRCNRAGNKELSLLNTRYQPVPKPDEEDSSALRIVLATRKDNVDFINQTELEKLSGDTCVLKGQIKGDFPESSLPTLMNLELKEGAQIIFVKNDLEKRWVNGTLGRIAEIQEDGSWIGIVTDSGVYVRTEPEKWSNVRYTYNEKEKKIEEEELGTFTQFPIRLAWAITIHKSQGLTFQRATIDFSGGTFAGGQAYVALSRCTSLEGIVLKKKVERSDVFVRPEVVQFAARFNNQMDLEHAMQKSKADHEYQQCVSAFDNGNMEDCLIHFYAAIHARYDIERPEVKRLIRKKLNKLNVLQSERNSLIEERNQMQRKLVNLAKEYVDMGNECLTQADCPKAAVANFRKALNLDPHSIKACRLLAEAYQKMGQVERAKKYTKEAEKIRQNRK